MLKYSVMKEGINLFSNYQEMYYTSKSMEFIVRKRLDVVHMALDCGYKPIYN